MKILNGLLINMLLIQEKMLEQLHPTVKMLGNVVIALMAIVAMKIILVAKIRYVFLKD